MSTEVRKVIQDSDVFWPIGGGSELYAVTFPDPPTANAATTVRLTHTSPSGPLAEADIFVRVGNPGQPTAPDALNASNDWIKARLVEELVTSGDVAMLRSEAQEPIQQGTPWEGTYDAQLVVPAGLRSIEVKMVSRNPKLLQSQVLTGWEIFIRQTQPRTMMDESSSLIPALKSPNGKVRFSFSSAMTLVTKCATRAWRVMHHEQPTHARSAPTR